MRNQRARVRWVPIVVAAVLVVALAGTGAAATPASISGKVVNRTQGARPVPNQAVTLHTLNQDAETATKTAVTDAKGAFSFAGLSTGSPWAYLVTTQFQQAEYDGPRMELATGQKQSFELTVWDATTSPANVSLSSWVVWVDRDNGIAVQQDLEIKNTGTTTYIGAEALPGDKRVVTKLPLASGASDIQYMGLFLKCCGVVQGTTLVHTRAIPPGTSQATLRYRVASASKLVFPAQFPTAGFALMVPSDMRVTTGRLAPGGTTEDRGVSYRILQASDLKAGETLELDVAASGSSGVPPLAVALFVVGGLALLSLVALKVRATRAARTHAKGRAPSRPAGRKPDRRPAKAPAPTPAPATPRAPAQVAPSGPDGNESELLVEEIAALDLAFEHRLLAEDTYRALRAARKARLVELREGREVKVE